MPYPNFWAWFWVVASFSFGYRLLARRKHWDGTWLSPPMAMVVGLGGILATNALITFIIPWTYTGWVVSITLAAALIFVVALGPRFYLTPVPSLVFWVPLLTHLYSLFAGLISGSCSSRQLYY